MMHYTHFHATAAAATIAAAAAFFPFPLPRAAPLPQGQAVPPASGKAVVEVGAAVPIPADKRHQGLSKFDLFPFTDRRKGDPDRYRAVNPNHVKKENGRYYYLLDARTDTHYFDENMVNKGVLTDKIVAVELSQRKEVKSGGKTLRYVFVKEKGYVLRSMLTPAATVKTGKWFTFPLKEGEHPLYDGTGMVRGVLAARAVRLNYGQQKQINGERCCYAFSTSVFPDGSREKKGASGWIKASAIQDGNDPQYTAEVVAKMQPPPAAETAGFTAYQITGGDPLQPSGSDTSGKPVYPFGYRDSSGAFISYKVLPGVPVTDNVAATDYLKRSDNVINLGFNVAGVSNDTYRVGGRKSPLVFHRSGERDATAAIDLFHPKDAAHDGTQMVGKMIFLYGYVAESDGKRWGWIALDALGPITPA